MFTIIPFISRRVAEIVVRKRLQECHLPVISIGMEGEPIRNVSLSNIRIQYRGGGKKVETPYREQGTNYPEPRWAGPTPAYGLFARHVDGLRLQNVRFELMQPDERPDIIIEDVKNIDQ